MPNIAEQIKKSLTQDALALINNLGKTARDLGYNIYIVGGPVRDMLLGRPIVDIDIVVEGDAIALARGMAKALGYQSKTHPRFGTANLYMSNVSADLVTARSETYEKPGALPTVTPSSLKSDLARRDFTMNAIAASVAPNDFGELIDYAGGLNDLKAGLIRVLHPNSFMDDATRIFRAVRYEQRLSFTIEPVTEGLIKQNLSMIDTISGNRLKNELNLIFKEDSCIKALERVDELGILKRLHPSLRGNGWLSAKLCKDCDQVILFALLTYNLNEEDCRDTLKRLNISGKNGQTIKEVQKIKKELNALSVHNLPFSRVYRMLENFSNEAVEVVILAEEPSAARQHLELYIEELQLIRPILDGNDLKRMGITTGRKIGQILKQLTNAKLDHKVRTRGEEERLVKSLIRGDKP